MCGIAGTWNWGERSDLERMGRSQNHRGPDDSGSWWSRLSDGTTLGLESRRLAILDLSEAGHMPMLSDDGNLVLVYNGEIYNFGELRRELESQGRRFRSETDTEVVLASYEAWGENAFARFNGMFALALWDARKHRLVLARDPFGIKPLYYCRRGERLAFASELKALFTLPQFPKKLDPFSIYQYLTFLWVPEPRTALEGVWKLPAGHWAAFDGRSFKTERFWRLDFPDAGAVPTAAEADLTSEVRRLFEKAVLSQKRSDVPLGCFLSAGLDSTGIAAVLARNASRPIDTYTISFPERYRNGGFSLDDASIAARTAKRLGCRHHEIRVDPDVRAVLPEVIRGLDEPIADPAAITARAVCLEAKPTSTVLLSGIGGDEVFAGYRKYVAHRWARRYQRLPGWFRTGMLEPWVARAPMFRGTPLQKQIRMAKKMARSASLGDRERFLMNCTYLDASQKEGLLNGPFLEAVGGREAWATHRGHFEEVEGADFLNQMLYLDFKTFLPSLNLAYNDKMSMAASVEVRVPFLDRDLVEFAARHVPPNLKLNGGTTKHIFREAIRPWIPEEVLRAPKAGFGAPVDLWINEDLAPWVDDVLSDSALRQRGLFNPRAVRDLIEGHRRGVLEAAYPIWALLSLELWQREFGVAGP